MQKWEKWAKAAGIRALRTFGEAALAYIGTGAIVLGDVNWIGVLSAGALGAITSVLLALAGLPEVEKEDITVVEYPPDEDQAEI